MQATSYPTQPGVPDQTVYVHQPVPVNYSTAVQNPNSSSGVSKNFNGTAGRATGILLVCLAMGNFGVAIFQFFLGSYFSTYGIGVWTAIFFYIPAGILGICTMKKNTCVIIAYLTMSIIAAIVALCQVIAGAIGAVDISDFGISIDYYSDSDIGFYRGLIASESLLAILGVIEMVTAIVASVYCCGGIACCTNQTLTTVNPNSSSGVSKNFNGTAGRATGIVLVCLAVGNFGLAVFQFFLGSYLSTYGIGLWTAIYFYIPAGILGICTMKKNTCVIVAYLTMNIIAAIVALCQVIAGAIGAIDISFYGSFCDYQYSSCDPEVYRGLIASESLLAIFGVIVMVTAIVASVYCCGGIACCTKQTSTTVYTQQTTPMVLKTGQFNQPQGIAQPPPAYDGQQAYSPADQPVLSAPCNHQAAAAPYNNQSAAEPNKTDGTVA